MVADTMDTKRKISLLQMTMVILMPFLTVFSSTPKAFRALVLPDTEKNQIAHIYDPQIKTLGIHPVYVTQAQLTDGSAYDLLADCEMMLVPPAFAGRMTNGAEKVRSWLEKGGLFVMHDAVYPKRLAWLADVDPKLALKTSGCSYGKKHPVEPVSPLLTTPRAIEYGGYWGHIELLTNTVWRKLVACDHAMGCNVALARYGKGVGLVVAPWQGDSTPMILNLRANAALVANDLTLISSEVAAPVAGDNTFRAKIRNDGQSAQAVSLVFNGCEKTTVTIAPGETGDLVLSVRIITRGLQRVRVALECAGLSSYLYDNDIRIRELFEVGSTRYRNLLSPGRRFEEIQFLSTVSPIDEKTDGAVARLDVMKGGQVISTLDTPAVARGPMRAKAKFPKSLAPGVYTVRGTLISASGTPLHVDESSVEILEPYPGLACVDEDMNFIVDEEPFLPIGLYHVKPEQYDEAAEMGINMIDMFGWEWSIGITSAFERGLRVILHPWQHKDADHAKTYGHNPGLFQWYIVDEPGDAQVPGSRLRNETFHATDKLHPTYLCSCTPHKFEVYGELADVLAPDPYPHTWDDPGIVGRWMDKAYEIYGDCKPLVCIPQSHLMETHREWLAMSHMALCHRSKGVFWYCWAQQGGGDLGVGIRNNEHRKDLPALIGRIRAMAPALLNAAESDYFVTEGVHGMTCRDPELGTRYMIVVNPLTNGAPVSAKVAWKGARKDITRAQEAFVVGDGFAMKNGVVDITLKPLEFRTLAVEGPVPAPIMLPPAPAKPSGKGVVRHVGRTQKFKTIQAAIDVSKPGDTILVAPGVYAPFSTSNNYLTIKSKAGAAKTTIDARGVERCVTLTARPFANMHGETNTVVEGFTLTGGVANQTRLHRNRGGLALGGTLRNCVLTKGVAQYGGAAAYARLEKCVLKGNRATKCGGAGAFVTACDSLFEKNASDFHGGAVFSSSIEGCRLIDNTAKHDAGAMYYGNADRCVFMRNTCAGNGGAVFSQDGSARNCIFDANVAGISGGGVYWSTVALSTFVGNKAPKGSGIAKSYAAEGCIFWQNDVADTPRLAGSLIGIDPQFKADTYIPRPDSPAVDRAGIAAKGADERDAAGRPRLKGMSTDAGAYEVGAKAEKRRLSASVVVYAKGSDTVSFPADVDVRGMMVRIKFRYDEKSGRLGEIVRYVGENGTGFRVGVYSGRPGTKGQVYGAVDYIATIGSAKKDGEKCDRTKVTDREKAKDFKFGVWHEAVLKINAYGADTAVSEFTVDGERGDVNYPWCRSHGQILRLGPGKVTVSSTVEIGDLEISVR